MWTPVCMEPTLKYHPLMFDVLTWTRDPGCGQCLVGSLTVGGLLLKSNGGARRLANPGRTSGG